MLEIVKLDTLTTFMNRGGDCIRTIVLVENKNEHMTGILYLVLKNLS